MGIHDGIEGLIAGNVKPVEWFVPYFILLFHVDFLLIFYFINRSDVTGWVAQGGAFLGTKRTLPGNKMAEVAARLKEFNIQGLLIIGGFEVDDYIHQ